MNDQKKSNAELQAEAAEYAMRAQREAMEKLGIKPLGGGALSDEYVLEIDAHAARASRNMGVSYAEFLRLFNAGDPRAKRERQRVKVERFYLAGLGSERFVNYVQRRTGDDKETATKKAAVLLKQFKKNFPDITGLLDVYGKCEAGTPNVQNIRRPLRRKEPLDKFTGVFRVKPRVTPHPWSALTSKEGIALGELYGTLKSRTPGKAVNFGGLENQMYSGPDEHGAFNAIPEFDMRITTGIPVLDEELSKGMPKNTLDPKEQPLSPTGRTPSSPEFQFNLEGSTTGRVRSDRPNLSNPPRTCVEYDYAELERRALAVLEEAREKGIKVCPGCAYVIRHGFEGPPKHTCSKKREQA